MSRWKASAIHLLLSAAIIAVIVGVVVSLWYPMSLLHVAGMDRLIGLVALVDLTVGPFLTLVIYKHGKRGLKMDLTVIGVVQAVLLGYGINALAQNRPVFLVGAVDRFELVTAKQIALEDLAKAKPPYDRLSWTGAVMVGALPPANGSEESSMLVTEALAGRDIHVQPKYFRALDQVRPQLLARAKPVSELVKRSSARSAAKLLSALDGDIAETQKYLPLNTATGSAVVFVDADTAAPIRTVAVDPWSTGEN